MEDQKKKKEIAYKEGTDEFTTKTQFWTHHVSLLQTRVPERRSHRIYEMSLFLSARLLVGHSEEQIKPGFREARSEPAALQQRLVLSSLPVVSYPDV